MHIEAPEEHHASHPFASLKDFVFHILTISLGLGLALAGEAGVEYYNHRELANETREFFRSQSEDNQKAVAAHIKATERDRDAIAKALALVNDNNDLPAAKTVMMQQSAHQFIELNTDSWDPAVATGALNYMKLAEVQRYSRIHVAELALNKLIHENEEVWFHMSEYNEGASEVDKDDIRAVKRLLREARTYAIQIAMREEALLKMYEEK